MTGFVRDPQQWDRRDVPGGASLMGWAGTFERGKRPSGIHPLASIGGPPEHPDWLVGDESLPPVIHGTALINAFCTVDAGMPGYPTTSVGPGAFLQARAHLGHNAVVGPGARVCVGAVICGHAMVGAGASVSANSWVKPWVKVGAGAIVGGGSVVTKDVPEHEVWAGNPCRFMKLAWTHPDYTEEAKPAAPDGWRALPRPVPVDELVEYGASALHPYHDPDAVWEFMRPIVRDTEPLG